MLRINPINTKSYNPSLKAAQSSKPIAQSEKNSSKLLFSLGGLATAGLVMVGLKKTAKMSYQEALKKAGVEIKNNIATKIENGEKFTGKIERFEKRNRKETVVFVDGVIQEKLYRNALGKELSGIFYKDGVEKLHIAGSAYGTHRRFGYFEYDTSVTGDGILEKGDSLFDVAREHLKCL